MSDQLREVIADAAHEAGERYGVTVKPDAIDFLVDTARPRESAVLKDPASADRLRATTVHVFQQAHAEQLKAFHDPAGVVIDVSALSRLYLPWPWSE